MVLPCVQVDPGCKSLLTVWTAIALQIGVMLTGAMFANAQDGYTLVGSARSGATVDCIQLTNSSNDQAGAFWFDKRIDLAKSFEFSFTINLGSNPIGADGLVLVFQAQGDQVLGGQAGGIGYRGLRPSLGIEFDTNQNFEAGDPPEDHVVLVRDGVSDHRLSTGFAAPVPISPTQNTVKDGRDHFVNVRWDARSRSLRVEVDCVQRISQTIDLVNTIFSGNSEVIWGFTAATGGRGNTHTVCFPKLVQPDTIRACRNDQVTLTAPRSYNGRYQWVPSAGLDNPQSRIPRLSVGSSQLYTVQYVDGCDQLKFDSVYVKARNPGVSIGEDQQVCADDTVALKPTLLPADIPVTYRWSTGQTTPRLNPTVSGQYSLTITADGCSLSDSARVTFNPLPQLSLFAEPAFDCPGNQPVQLDPKATGSDLQHFWTPGDSRESTLMATLPGVYRVQITTGMGCSATQQFTILDNCPSTRVFIPDAFTPNGDGINDVLTWKGESNSDARMMVFDRWGEIVFTSTELSPYWDGTYKGALCPPAIYTWSLDYRPPQATKQPRFIKHGRVLLLK